MAQTKDKGAGLLRTLAALRLAPHRFSLQGRASDLKSDPWFWGLQWTPFHNFSVPRQVILATACCFTKHGAPSRPASQPVNHDCCRSPVAWCPPLPGSSSSRPGCQAWCAHTQVLPWPGLEEHSLALPHSEHHPSKLALSGVSRSPPALTPSSVIHSCLTILTAYLSTSSLACLWFSSSWLPGFLATPPPSLCFLSTGYKWKTSVPWSFARVPFIVFLEASRSNPAPRAGSSLPATLAKVRALGPRLGAGLTLPGPFPHSCATGSALSSGWHCVEKQGALSRAQGLPR